MHDLRSDHRVLLGVRPGDRAPIPRRAAFARRFTETVGMTPMHYLLEWRLALAKDLLRSGTLSTAQIAARVGYRSAPAFTTAFARATGCSPTEFARRYSIA